MRNLRAEANLSPTQAIAIYASGSAAGMLTDNKAVFESLTRATLLSEQPSGAALSQPLPDLDMKLPLTGLVDIDEWRARQEKRLQEVQKNLAVSEKKLNNEKFVANAPAAVVEEERRRVAEAQELIAGLNSSLAQLG